jgi:hypothetical protein
MGPFQSALYAESIMKKREKADKPSPNPHDAKAEKFKYLLSRLLVSQGIVKADGEFREISMENFDGGEDRIPLPIPKIGENGKEYAKRLNGDVSDIKEPSFYSGMSADFNYIYESGKLVGIRVAAGSALVNGFAQKYNLH